MNSQDNGGRAALALQLLASDVWVVGNMVNPAA
jgi:hypothetical protein